MPTNRYLTVYRGRKKRGPNTNKTRPVESRGQHYSENKILRSFWREHKMDDIIAMTPEELDTTIDTFYTNYENRQRKQNPNWWYPATFKKIP